MNEVFKKGYAERRETMTLTMFHQGASSMGRSLVPLSPNLMSLVLLLRVLVYFLITSQNQRQLFHEKPQILRHPMCRVTPFRMPVLKSLVLSSFSLQLSPSPTILQHTQVTPRYLVPGASLPASCTSTPLPSLSPLVSRTTPVDLDSTNIAF